MKNYILPLMLAFCFYGSSCVKNPAPPLAYYIDTFKNAYVPNNDSAALSVNVRFLTGNANEQVWVTIAGLPAHVRLNQDTIIGTPNYTANFELYTNDATLGYYPVTLVSYSPSTGIRTMPFTLGVVTSSCANSFGGSFTGSNTCTSSNFTYAVTSTVTSANSLALSNFGGYGPGTSTAVTFDCNTDSLFIPSQNIGNGVTVSGKGYFSATGMVISYTALNTPGGFNDNCTATLVR